MRLGLDIGGTKTAAAIVRDDGSVAALCTAPSGHGPHEVIRVAAGLARQVIARNGGPAPTSAGACMPGLVEPASGMVRHAVNLGVAEVNLAAGLEAELGFTVAVENDVKAAALGADQLLAARTGIGTLRLHRYGAHAPAGIRVAEPPATHRTLAYLNIGTGLAAAVVRDGEVLRGADGVVGEIGHLPMGGAVRCTCGQFGCLETLASGSALKRMWSGSVPGDGTGSGHGNGTRGRDPFAAAAAGDRRAAEAAAVLCGGIALALQLLVLTTGADRIVLGGGLVALGSALHDGIRSELDRRARASDFVSSLGLADRFELLPSDVPVAALGAALLPHRH